MGRFKNFLKKFLPPPVNTFNREMAGLRKFIAKKNKAVLSGQEETAERILEALARQQEQLADQQKRTKRMERRLLAGQRQETARLVEVLAWQQEQIRRIGDRLEEQLQMGRQTSEKLAALERSLDAIGEQERRGLEALGSIQAQGAALGSSLNAIGAQERSELDVLDFIRRQSIITSRYASEGVWASIFNSTTINSGWLQDKMFSPGRMAVGYQYLYAMYRVLNEVHPKRILELGLGQSSRMIAQYSAAEPDVTYVVVEADADWKSFFENTFNVPPSCEIVLMEYEMTPYKDAEEVRTFKGFSERFSGQKFDFISIDAPLGSNMDKYARVDVLKLLPECISEDFVIMMDDCDRVTERNTVAEMEKALEEAGIAYKTGTYSGKKDCVLIAAEHLGFLTTM